MVGFDLPITKAGIEARLIPTLPEVCKPEQVLCKPGAATCTFVYHSEAAARAAKLNFSNIPKLEYHHPASPLQEAKTVELGIKADRSDEERRVGRLLSPLYQAVAALPELVADPSLNLGTDLKLGLLRLYHKPSHTAMAIAKYSEEHHKFILIKHPDLVAKTSMEAAIRKANADAGF